MQTTKSFQGNVINRLLKGTEYINESPIVLTQNELSKNPKINDRIRLNNCFFLNNKNNTPGIYPHNAVPTLIIGLYTPSGNIIAQRKSPTNAATKPKPGPSIYPATKPMEEINDI